MSKIDLNGVWDDARAMGASSGELLAAVAGMFVLLPGAIADQLMTPTVRAERELPFSQALDIAAQHLTDNWPVVLGHGLVTSFGMLAMLALLLRPDRPTVAESLRAALIVLPSYCLASLLQSAIIFCGAMLFVLPGIYAIGRLALIAAVAAGEGCFNPFDILRRSFVLTRRNGWRIVAVMAVLLVTVMIAGIVADTLVGIAAELLLPADFARLAGSIMTGLFEAVLAAMMALLTAAFYRAAILAPTPAPWGRA